MVAWTVAPSLDALLGQLNRHAPTRSKISDGSIGDAAHASRISDHNPWLVLQGQSWVTARDFTHDPDHGLDCQHLRDALVTSRDPRIKYIIWRNRITSGDGGTQPWVSREYIGSNPHTAHLHLSVVDDVRCLDAAAWTLPGFDAVPTLPPPPPAPPLVKVVLPTLREGMSSSSVMALHQFLTTHFPSYADFTPTGYFGSKTKAAVQEFQRRVQLDADGIVGPDTNAALYSFGYRGAR